MDFEKLEREIGEGARESRLKDAGTLNIDGQAVPVFLITDADGNLIDDDPDIRTCSACGEAVRIELDDDGEPAELAPYFHAVCPDPDER
jgi:hypothetical protein